MMTGPVLLVPEAAALDLAAAELRANSSLMQRLRYRRAMRLAAGLAELPDPREVAGWLPGDVAAALLSAWPVSDGSWRVGLAEAALLRPYGLAGRSAGDPVGRGLTAFGQAVRRHFKETKHG